MVSIFKVRQFLSKEFGFRETLMIVLHQLLHFPVGELYIRKDLLRARMEDRQTWKVESTSAFESRVVLQKGNRGACAMLHHCSLSLSPPWSKASLLH